MKQFSDYLDNELYVNIEYASFIQLTNWSDNGVSCESDNALYYITDGEAKININGKNHLLKKGDLCLIPEASKISYEQTSELFEKYYIHFDMNYDSVPVLSMLEFQYVYNIGYNSDIIRKFRNLAANMHDNGNCGNLECISDLFFILTAFFSNNPAKYITFGKKELNSYKTLGYINENFKNNINVEIVSKAVGAHSKYFSKLFKEQFGVGINKFINFKKIDYIYYTMIFNNISLKKVMTSVNYYDYKSFNNWFSTLKNTELKKHLKREQRLFNPEFKKLKGCSFSGGVCEFVDLNCGAVLNTVVSGTVFICLTEGKCEVVTNNYSSNVCMNQMCVISNSFELKIQAVTRASFYILRIGNISGDYNINDISCKLINTDLSEYAVNAYNAFKKGIVSICDYFEFLIYFTRIYALVFEKEKNNSTRNFELILKYIGDNLKSSLTVPEIAKQFNISHKNLVLLFKKNTGKTPSEYISSVRYEKALEYMNTPGCSLYNAASLLGYQSYEGFRMFIKRMSGEFPNKLKENVNHKI